MQKIDEVKRDKRDKIDKEITTELLNSLFEKTNFEYKEYTYERIDMCFTGKTLFSKCTYDIEIKSRDLHTYRFNDCYMQCDKYDAMLSGIYTNERKLYIGIYHMDNTIFVWDIEKIKNIQQYKHRRWMNEQTCSDKPKKVLKNVYELPFNLAIKKTFECKGKYNKVLN